MLKFGYIYETHNIYKSTGTSCLCECNYWQKTQTKNIKLFQVTLYIPSLEDFHISKSTN